MELGLTSKRVLITGASRGIGRATAETFAREAADIAICARGAEGVADAVTAIKAARGAADVQAFGSACDVREVGALEAWVSDSLAALGGIDIVVSNVSTRIDPKSPSWWSDSFEADLMQHVRLKTLVLPHLAPGASLVFVASVAASLTTLPPYEEAYGAMKAGLVNLVGQWAQALGPRGIRVNAVSPGPIDFPGGWWDKVRDANPEAHQRAASMAALGRLGAPEDVASAVAFLASPRAAFISGANLRIDGALIKAANF